MSDAFAGTGVESIIKPLRPKGAAWQEIPADQRFSGGHPLRTYLHRDGLFVMSAVEFVADTGKAPQQEYHISISRHTAAGPQRCDTSAAKWVLRQFGAEGFIEDNHVPFGRVRNFWRPLANPLVGEVCGCNAVEPAIVEDKGDFTWRGITE